MLQASISLSKTWGRLGRFFKLLILWNMGLSGLSGFTAPKIAEKYNYVNKNICFKQFWTRKTVKNGGQMGIDPVTRKLLRASSGLLYTLKKILESISALW